MIENRHCRVEYLLETTTSLGTEEALLWEIVRGMSDSEFDSIYQYMCRMHDIEPDEEVYYKRFEDAEKTVALQGC
jgi:hypothetical protein